MHLMFTANPNNVTGITQTSRPLNTKSQMTTVKWNKSESPDLDFYEVSRLDANEVIFFTLRVIDNFVCFEVDTTESVEVRAVNRCGQKSQPATIPLRRETCKFYNKISTT